MEKILVDWTDSSKYEQGTQTYSDRDPHMSLDQTFCVPAYDVYILGTGCGSDHGFTGE